MGVHVHNVSVTPKRSWSGLSTAHSAYRKSGSATLDLLTTSNNTSFAGAKPPVFATPGAKSFEVYLWCWLSDEELEYWARSTAQLQKWLDNLDFNDQVIEGVNEIAIRGGRSPLSVQSSMSLARE